jgi:hypothetical protein
MRLGEVVKTFIREVAFALLFVFAATSIHAASSDVGGVLMQGPAGRFTSYNRPANHPIGT